MFLLQKNFDKKVAKISKFDFLNPIIEEELVPGPYILFCKIDWKEEQSRNFTMNCYGPEKVVFKKLNKWNPQLLEDFILSKYQQG